MYCTNCGKQISDTASACDYCGTAVKRVTSTPVTPVSTTVEPVVMPDVKPVIQPQAPQAPKAPKKENLVAGIVGAVLGAAIGGASIILLSQIGYVAALSGIILSVCTFKGYELLGGKLSKKGLIISLLLILVTPYIADRMDWAILVAQEFGVSFGQAFGAIPALLEEEVIVGSTYWGNLALIYLFTALGSFSTIWNAFKK